MLRYCSRLILVAVAVRAAPDSEPPTTWVDPDTGHRIVRLTREPGSASLYFNQNGYTADGKKMVYTTPDGISVLDLKTHAAKPVVQGKVDRKSTRLNSSHGYISYAVFCLKKKKNKVQDCRSTPSLQDSRRTG